MKTFFFSWRSYHFSNQTTAFSPSVLDFTKPEIRHIWAGPRPTLVPGGTASRTHFEVLGLEASSPRKLPCPRLEYSTIFWVVKSWWSAWKIFWKTFFSGDCLKNFCKDLFFIYLLLLLSSGASESATVRQSPPTHCVGLIWAHCNCSCYVIAVLFG